MSGSFLAAIRRSASKSSKGSSSSMASARPAVLRRGRAVARLFNFFVWPTRRGLRASRRPSHAPVARPPFYPASSKVAHARQKWLSSIPPPSSPRRFRSRCGAKYRMKSSCRSSRHSDCSSRSWATSSSSACSCAASAARIAPPRVRSYTGCTPKVSCRQMLQRSGAACRISTSWSPPRAPKPTSTLRTRQARTMARATHPTRRSSKSRPPSPSRASSPTALPTGRPLSARAERARSAASTTRRATTRSCYAGCGRRTRPAARARGSTTSARILSSRKPPTGGSSNSTCQTAPTLPRWRRRTRQRRSAC